MGIDVLPIAKRFAEKAIPALAGVLAGPGAAVVADKVVGIAKELTGHDDPEKAIESIITDQSLLAHYKNRLLDQQLSMRQSDSLDLQTINQTIRSELSSRDPYNSRWRSTYGYCVSATWVINIFGVIGALVMAIFQGPEKISAVASAVTQITSALLPLWGISMSILGLNVYKRSQDKQLSAGESPKGFLETILSLKK